MLISLLEFFCELSVSLQIRRTKWWPRRKERKENKKRRAGRIKYG
jgi:hypothetical protein